MTLFDREPSKPRLKGNSPVRGNVCKADKRVPVSGRKGGSRKTDGEVKQKSYRKSVAFSIKVMSESVSRVLSFKAIICLDLELLQGSSHPSVFCAQLTADKSVLLRVGFTWPHSLLCAGELLPRLSILTVKTAVYFCCTIPKVALGGR